MKHLILGGGNLGLDLAGEARRRGHEAVVLTRSTGFDVENPEHLFPAVTRSDYDVLWYALGGAGLPAKATRQEVDRSARINATIPGVIARVAPADRRLVFFSSDVCADESAPNRTERSNPTPTGHFARIKLTAERQLARTARPFTTVVRVGSLFGWHKPADTFPGRMLEAFGFNRDTSIQLPANLVTPTPTLWVAAHLVERVVAEFEAVDAKRSARHIGVGRGLRGVDLIHCAPRGNVSVRDWAIMTLQGLREASAFAPQRSMDPERPAFSALGCSFATVPHWHDVWRTYFRPRWFTPVALRHLLPAEGAPPGGGGGAPAS